MKSFSFRFPDAGLLRRTACFTIIAVFCTHAFALFNLTYSSESIVLNASNAMYAQIESGQYLQAIYLKLRGGIASPLMIGILSTLYLALSLTLIVDLLGLSSKWLQFALCASVCAHPSVTAVFAARMYTADALFLSLLFVASGIWLCRRIRLGLIPGAAFLCAAIALEAGSVSIAAGLILLVLCRDLMNPSCEERPSLHALKACAALGTGCAVYALGHIVMLRLVHCDSSAILHLSESLLGAWIYPVRMLFSPLTAYTHLTAFLRAALILASLLVILRLPSFSLHRRAALIICSLLLPLAVNLPVYSSEAAGQVQLSFVLIDILILLIIQQAACPRLHLAVFSIFAVLFVSGVVFSNQVYLKKNLEFESALSRMTRIIDRAEDTAGFQPGLTPVAIIGRLDNPSVTKPLKGFEHLAVFEAAAANSPVNTQEDMVWYCWEILGYPFNFVSNYEHALLAEDAAVKAMPSFPHPQCCQFVSDVLVIKLSD